MLSGKQLGLYPDPPKFFPQDDEDDLEVGSFEWLRKLISIFPN